MGSAGETPRRCRQPARDDGRPRCRLLSGQTGITTQQAQVQLAELVTGFLAQLVGEAPTHPRVVVERLRPPTRHGERTYDEAGQGLGQRIVSGRLEQQVGRAGELSEPLVMAGPQDQRRQPLLTERLAMPAWPVAIQIGKWLATPQVQRGVHQLDRLSAARLVLGHLLGGHQVAPELGHVHPVRAHVAQVATVRANDADLRRDQRPLQLTQIGVQAGGRIAWQIRPHPIGQHVQRYGNAGKRDQRREHQPRLRRPDVQVPVAGSDPYRPQQRDPHCGSA